MINFCNPFVIFFVKNYDNLGKATKVAKNEHALLMLEFQRLRKVTKITKNHKKWSVGDSNN